MRIVDMREVAPGDWQEDGRAVIGQKSLTNH
jgi:hypothetical protein